MADFVAPQFQYPDLLASAARGQAMGMNQAMFPGQLALQGQEIQSGALNLQQLKQMMAIRQGAYQSYQQTMQGLNQPNGAQPTGQQPGDPGTQNGGAVSQPQTGYDPNNPLGPLLDPRRIQANAAIGSLNNFMAGKDPNAPVADALKLESDSRDYQIKNAQIRSQLQGSPLVTLQEFASNPNAASAMLNNPGMLSKWPQVATKYGINPKDLSDVNVRRVATLAANEQRVALQLPPLPMPENFTTTQRGLGESIQTDDQTGKVSAGAPTVATDKFVDKSGNVVEMPKAQGVAQGLTPYDPTLYAAGQISDKTLEQAYQASKASGDLTQAVAGRDPIASVKISNYIADRAQKDGLTGVAMAAQKQTYAAQQEVLKDYMDPNGKAGGKLQSVNTVTEHAQALYPLIDALKTGNTQLINKASIAYQQQTGKPAPTNLKMLAGIFGQEVINGVTQNGGDKDEREQLVEPLQTFNSPDQLKDAIRTAATAMAGKTRALGKAWDVAMKGTQGPFDQFLTPATKQFLGGGSSHPPAIQALIDKYPGK